jgi:hypothetical protein
MFLGSRARPVRGAENLTAICGPIACTALILNISHPNRPPRPVTGIALLNFYFLHVYMSAYNNPKSFLLWVSASCCACNNEWVQQSFVRNSVSACFIKHVFRLKSKPSSGVIVYRILPDDGLDLSRNMLCYTCLIKQAETLLRTKDCCTHSIPNQFSVNATSCY